MLFTQFYMGLLIINNQDYIILLGSDGMRKFLTSILLFVVCSTFCSAFFVAGNNKVVAADVDSANYVYYAGFAKDADTSMANIFAYSVVSQYFYKNLDNLSGKGSNKETLEYVKESNQYNSINTDSNEICKFSGFENLCVKVGKTKKLLNLASIAITNGGHVSVDLQNGVIINSLRLFYIVADSSGEALTYCSNKADNNICDGAKRVAHGNSTWKNAGKYQKMVFSQSSMESIFNYSEEESGIKHFTGFNIFEQMDGTQAKLAQSAGAYVIPYMSITYKGVEYYLNGNLINEVVFDNNIGNHDTKKTYAVFKNPQANAAIVDEIFDACISTSLSESGKARLTLSSRAALIMPSNTAGSGGNSALNILMKFFKDNLQPIIMVVVGIMFVIGGISTGINIVKSGDEPETRRQEIKKLVGLITALVAIELILYFYEEIIDAIMGLGLF